MQPDTVIPDLSNPQSWNRYSYVANRPVNFSDPTGHMMDDGNDGGCVSILDCKTKKTPTPTSTRGANPPYRSTPTPTMNPTLSSFLTTSPTGTIPTLGPAYVQGPTATATATPTGAPSVTPTHIPISTLNPDHASQGVQIGQTVAESVSLIETAGQHVFSKGSLGLSFLIGAAAQWMADSNNGLGMSEQAFRSTVVGVESVLVGAIAGGMAASVLVAGGGPANPMADVAAIGVFVAATVILTNTVQHYNENVLFPEINKLYDG